MIGSLMYLIASRPNIMLLYLKGQPKLGLWYPKDSPFDLEAYTDSDYAGASLGKKSTTGGCQFLGRRLISWQLGRQNGKGFPTSYISLEAEQDSGNINRTQSMRNPNDSFLRELIQIQALLDGKKVIITETSVRRALHLKDAKGTDWLPTAIIFAELERIVFLDKQVDDMSKNKEIYVTPSHTKKIFANMKREGKGFSSRVTPLFQTMMVQAPEEGSLALENSNTSSAAEIATLKERVKKLEKKRRSRTYKPRRLYKVTLIDENQGRNDKDLMFDIGILNGNEVFQEPIVNTATKSSIPDSATDPVTTAGEVVITASVEIPEELTLGQTLIEIKSAKPKALKPFATTAKEKGKAKIVETEKPLKKKDQIAIDEEVFRNLEAQLQAELEE
ncbi:hypothetical protein Tco_0549502 [Tanacetum coccineum]